MSKGDAKRAQKMIDSQGAQQTNRMNQIYNQNYNQYQGNQPGAQSTTGGDPNLEGARNPNGTPATGTTTPGNAGARNPNAAAPGGNQNQPQDIQAWFNQFSQGKTASPTFLKDNQAAIEAAGFKLENPNAAGIVSKIINPQTGQIIRVLNNADNPSAGVSFGWVPQSGSAGGAGGAGGGQDFTASHGDYGKGLLSPALGGYRNFAETGGFSPQDIQNIRARSVAPIRAMYAQGQDELERSKNIQGGYSPNFAPAMAKLQREGSYKVGEQALNTEAEIATQVRQGRLAGIGGLAQTGQAINNAGQAATQNSGQYGLGLIGAQINKSQVPSNYQQALGNIYGTAKTAGTIGTMGYETGLF